MSLTLDEIKEKILHLYDPDDLDRFEDKLLRKLDQFTEELEEEVYDA